MALGDPEFDAMECGNGKVENAGMMIVTMHNVEGACSFKEAGKSGGCRSGLSGGRTKMETGSESQEAGCEGAEILFFESKMKVWP